MCGSKLQIQVWHCLTVELCDDSSLHCALLYVGPNHSLACCDLSRNVGGNWESAAGMWVGWVVRTDGGRWEEGGGRGNRLLNSPLARASTNLPPMIHLTGWDILPSLLTRNNQCIAMHGFVCNGQKCNNIDYYTKTRCKIPSSSNCAFLEDQLSYMCCGPRLVW